MLRFKFGTDVNCGGGCNILVKVYLVVIGQRFRKQKKFQLLKRGGGEAVISKEQMFLHIEADGGCEVV